MEKFDLRDVYANRVRILELANIVRSINNEQS